MSQRKELGKKKKTWMSQIEEDLSSMEIKNEHFSSSWVWWQDQQTTNWFLPQCFPSHLWNEQLTWRQLSARLLHLAVALQLKVFQVVAALHHGFHLRLYLVDVETGDSELLLDRSGDLHRLEMNEEEEEREVSRNVLLRLSTDECVCVCVCIQYTQLCCLADSKVVHIE